MDKRRELPSSSEPTAEIRHLPRRPLSLSAKRERENELTIADHFRQQNELLKENNKSLTEQMRRLANGVETLAAEMHGFRTGRKEEAFARICGLDGSPDLPTVKAEAALLYIYTAKKIAEMLGGVFQPSQIGLLLSKRGLQWAGNGDYQEIGRVVNLSQSKFWHREVPNRLRAVLDENDPAKYGIKDKSTLAIFRRWQEWKERERLLEELQATTQPH